MPPGDNPIAVNKYYYYYFLSTYVTTREGKMGGKYCQVYIRLANL
jgi:hypothetical protein